MDDVLSVQSRRAARQQKGQRVQHALAALILVSYGVNRFSLPHSGIPLLAVCEFGAGALLVIGFVRERLRKRPRQGVAWVELAGAVMAFVEAVERTQGRHHVSFVILSYAAPLPLLLFAIFDARIAALRTLKASDDAYEVRLRLFFRRRVRFDEVTAFRIAGDAMEFELARGGRRRISLRDVADRDAALGWSAEQFRRRGIPESAPSPDGSAREPLNKFGSLRG